MITHIATATDETEALSSHGIEVTSPVPIVIAPTQQNTAYLDTAPLAPLAAVA